MEQSNTLNPEMLKILIKEGVREVMREEWYKFFEMLLPYVDDAEQADIEAIFNPDDYLTYSPALKGGDSCYWFSDITYYFK